MFALAIDTSTPLLSLAVGEALAVGEGESLLASSEELVNRSHAELLPLHCDSVLKKAAIAYRNLGVIILGSGPGSFTGLRIGYGFAKGLAVSLKIPVVAFSSFSAFADGDGFTAIGDARSGLYFFAHGTSKPTLLEAAELRSELEVKDEAIFSFDDLSTLCDPSKVRRPNEIAVRLLKQGLRSKIPSYSVELISELAPLYVRPAAAKTIRERGQDKRA